MNLQNQLQLAANTIAISIDGDAYQTLEERLRSTRRPIVRSAGCSRSFIIRIANWGLNRTVSIPSAAYPQIPWNLP